MGVVEHIRDVLSGDQHRDRSSATDRDQSGTPDQEASGPDDGSDSRTTNLYRCEPCGTTYVTDELGACPRCEGSVERVPTEQDLGLV